ncbi:MAG: hypothetical protein KC457_06485 [Myxococcales bacterium]|nr:hypothetical protein [Myxococcales bacterium]
MSLLEELDGAGDLWIHATASQRTHTRYGPWVNLLRGTLGCFAAAVGGADSIATAPFDGLCGPEGGDADGLGRGSELGRRLALNTQLILREESHLGRFIDPAGGSWTVEALTDAVARRAWDRFRSIEREGGVAAGLLSGAIQRRIGEQARALQDKVASRKLPITGVSTFPVLDEHAPPAQVANEFSGEGPGPLPRRPHVDPQEDRTTITPLPRLRLAAPFEALRDAARAWANAHGKNPTIASINLGPLARHQARADFAANCFGAGGLTMLSISGDSTSEAAAAVEQAGCTLAVICGHDEDYPTQVIPLHDALREVGVREIWVAGRPPDPGTWASEGQLRFVYMGCNVLEALTIALRTLGATTNENGKEA